MYDGSSSLMLEGDINDNTDFHSAMDEAYAYTAMSVPGAATQTTDDASKSAYGIPMPAAAGVDHYYGGGDSNSSSQAVL